MAIRDSSFLDVTASIAVSRGRDPAFSLAEKEQMFLVLRACVCEEKVAAALSAAPRGLACVIVITHEEARCAEGDSVGRRTICKGVCFPLLFHQKHCK